MKLSKEEKEILNNIEKYEKVTSPELINFLQQGAKNTIQKSKGISIRLSVSDLEKIKTRAVKNGIPYQTLISTILHKFATNQIKVEL